MAAEQLGYNAPDGMTMGASATEKISFYGATTVVQYPSVEAASTYLISSNPITSSGFGAFQSAAVMSTFVAQVSTVVAALKACGLVA